MAESVFSAENIRLVQADAQKNGRIITHREMMRETKRYGRLYGAYTFFSQNPDKIPADWKGKIVLFPGTEFVGPIGTECCRGAIWDGQVWVLDNILMGGQVGLNNFVPAPASPRNFVRNFFSALFSFLLFAP